MWNWGLALNEARYENGQKVLTVSELSRELTRIKKNADTAWLREIAQHTLTAALRDLWSAYQSFYRKLKAEQKTGMPKFKAKSATIPSFYTRNDRLHPDGKGYMHIDKVGEVRYKSHINLQGIKLRNPRIKFEHKKWMLKCVIESVSPSQTCELRDCAMGIDVGVKSLAVVSMNCRKRVFKNINRSHKVRRLVKQLKHHQRALSRKKKGSANRLKERAKVRELYGRLKRIRHDYVQKVTRAIVEMKPRAIAEQNLYLFRQLIEYKAGDMGITVKYADRYYPSSKTCSGCGHVREKLRLNERVYKCSECGLEIDRDYNAALNLQRLAE